MPPRVPAPAGAKITKIVRALWLAERSVCMRVCKHGCRLRVVPHFPSRIVERAKRERAWKSPLARKGDTWLGERKMRDYRQNPSFWPFTADWFWSVKFVSPSKSIKHIQWDSFPHWAVIALVIGKLRGIFIAKKENPDTNFTHAKMMLVPIIFFFPDG